MLVRRLSVIKLYREAYDLFDGVTVDDDKDNLTFTVDNVTVPDQMLVIRLRGISCDY